MLSSVAKPKFPVPLNFLKEAGYPLERYCEITYRHRIVELVLYGLWNQRRTVDAGGRAFLPIDSAYQVAKVLDPKAGNRPHSEYFDQVEKGIELLLDLGYVDWVVEDNKDYLVFSQLTSDALQSVPTYDSKHPYRWLDLNHIVACRSGYQLAVYEFAMQWHKAIADKEKEVSLAALRTRLGADALRDAVDSPQGGNRFGRNRDRNDGRFREKILTAVKSLRPLIGIEAEWRRAEGTFLFYPHDLEKFRQAGTLPRAKSDDDLMDAFLLDHVKAFRLAGDMGIGLAGNDSGEKSSPQRLDPHKAHGRPWASDPFADY